MLFEVGSMILNTFNKKKLNSFKKTSTLDGSITFGMHKSEPLVPAHFTPGQESPGDLLSPQPESGTVNFSGICI